jgi:hypothetical protein
MENNRIEWDNMGNASIKMKLEELIHEQNALKDRIIKLSEKLESVEKDYFYGNKILIKRYKGED